MILFNIKYIGWSIFFLGIRRVFSFMGVRVKLELVLEVFVFCVNLFNFNFGF